MPWACRRARWCGSTREGHGLRLRPRPAPRHGEAAAGAGDRGAGGARVPSGAAGADPAPAGRATGGSRPCSRSRLIARAGLGRAGLGHGACRASGRGGGIWARAWRGWCGGIRAGGWRSSAATSPASAPPTWRPRSGGWARRTRRSGRRRMAATGWWRSARAGPRIPSRGVRWSGPHALADTLRGFAGRPVALLRRLRDIDTAADWRAWRC